MNIKRMENIFFIFIIKLIFLNILIYDDSENYAFPKFQQIIRALWENHLLRVVIIINNNVNQTAEFLESIRNAKPSPTRSPLQSKQRYVYYSHRVTLLSHYSITPPKILNSGLYIARENERGWNRRYPIFRKFSQLSVPLMNHPLLHVPYIYARVSVRG